MKFDDLNRRRKVRRSQWLIEVVSELYFSDALIITKRKKEREKKTKKRQRDIKKYIKEKKQTSFEVCTF